MDRRLTDRGLAHRVVVYEGAPHSFFDRAATRWADACADAWRQMLTFIDNPAAGLRPRPLTSAEQAAGAAEAGASSGRRPASPRRRRG